MKSKKEFHYLNNIFLRALSFFFEDCSIRELTALKDRSNDILSKIFLYSIAKNVVLFCLFKFDLTFRYNSS